MKPHVTTNALFLRVPYLEELKQHVIEVGGDVHHADGKVLVYTGGDKKACLSSTPFQIPHHSTFLHQCPLFCPRLLYRLET